MCTSSPGDCISRAHCNVLLRSACLHGGRRRGRERDEDAETHLRFTSSHSIWLLIRRPCAALATLRERARANQTIHSASQPVKFNEFCGQPSAHHHLNSLADHLCHTTRAPWPPLRCCAVPCRRSLSKLLHFCRQLLLFVAHTNVCQFCWRWRCSWEEEEEESISMHRRGSITITLSN